MLPTKIKHVNIQQLSVKVFVNHTPLRGTWTILYKCMRD